MRNPGCLDRAELFKLQTRADSCQEALAAAEKNWDDVQLQFVDQSGRLGAVATVAALSVTRPS